MSGPSDLSFLPPSRGGGDWPRAAFWCSNTGPRCCGLVPFRSPFSSGLQLFDSKGLREVRHLWQLLDVSFGKEMFSSKGLPSCFFKVLIGIIPQFLRYPFGRSCVVRVGVQGLVGGQRSLTTSWFLEPEKASLQAPEAGGEMWASSNILTHLLGWWFQNLLYFPSLFFQEINKT